MKKTQITDYCLTTEPTLEQVLKLNLELNLCAFGDRVGETTNRRALPM